MVRAAKTPSPSSAAEEKRRLRSTEKEKKRNIDINKAFDCLQGHLPECVPKTARLPKIKTLRLALKYIEHLHGILNGNSTNPDYVDTSRPLSLDDFATVAMREIQVRNTYTDRLHEDAANPAAKRPIPSPPTATSNCSNAAAAVDYPADPIHYQTGIQQSVSPFEAHAFPSFVHPSDPSTVFNTSPTTQQYLPIQPFWYM